MSLGCFLAVRLCPQGTVANCFVHSKSRIVRSSADMLFPNSLQGGSRLKSSGPGVKQVTKKPFAFPVRKRRRLHTSVSVAATVANEL